MDRRTLSSRQGSKARQDPPEASQKCSAGPSDVQGASQQPPDGVEDLAEASRQGSEEVGKARGGSSEDFVIFREVARGSTEGRRNAQTPRRAPGRFPGTIGRSPEARGSP